jgi:hypothetical protein
MTNEQKAARLEEIATHYIQIGQKDATLLREAAAMMRERGESGWTAQFEREYKGKTLAVVEAGPVGWYWYVDGSADYEAEIAPTLEAAQAAAVAWVDEQEGCDA